MERESERGDRQKRRRGGEIKERWKEIERGGIDQREREEER
jgi:hypothetical protein